MVSGREYEFEVEQGTQFRLQLSGNGTGRDPKVLQNGRVIPTSSNPNIFYEPNSIDVPSAQQFHNGQYKAIAPNGAEITFRLKVIGTSLPILNQLTDATCIICFFYIYSHTSL